MPDNTKPEDAVEVLQADWDRTQSIWDNLCTLSAGEQMEALDEAFARHRLAALRASSPVGEGWKPIDNPPEENMAVLVLFGNRKWRDLNGAPINLCAVRQLAEACEIGFYENGQWLESGTAHDMFESWRELDNLPTMWQPITAAPVPPTGDQ